MVQYTIALNNDLDSCRRQHSQREWAMLCQQHSTPAKTPGILLFGSGGGQHYRREPNHALLCDSVGDSVRDSICGSVRDSDGSSAASCQWQLAKARRVLYTNPPRALCACRYGHSEACCICRACPQAASIAVCPEAQAGYLGPYSAAAPVVIPALPLEQWPLLCQACTLVQLQRVC